MNFAPPVSDPRVSDLIQAGRLRVGLFPPQYSKDPATGEFRGPWIEVARALGAHIGVEVVVIEQPTPGKLIECLNRGDCDIGSLGFDPARAAQVGGFSPPFMQMDFTCLVPAGSEIRHMADADRPGVRIAAVREHASTLALSRTLRHAEALDTETPDAAFELLRSGKTDAWASTRPTLLDYARQLPGSRLLDNYGANFPALVVAKGQDARLAYVSEFIVDAKASGILQRAIERAGQTGYQVA